MYLVYFDWLRWGFVTAVKDVLQVKENGLIAGGPPCGQWIWINSSTHGRKKNNIFGNTSRAHVKASNTFLAFYARVDSWKHLRTNGINHAFLC